MVVSFYSVLGVTRSASLAQIKKAFKQCALAVHPDKGGTDARFQEAMEAFETLTDAKRRKQYDLGLGTALSTSASGQQHPTAVPQKERSSKKRPSSGGGGGSMRTGCNKWKRASSSGGDATAKRLRTTDGSVSIKKRMGSRTSCGPSADLSASPVGIHPFENSRSKSRQMAAAACPKATPGPGFGMEPAAAIVCAQRCSQNHSIYESTKAQHPVLGGATQRRDRDPVNRLYQLLKYLHPVRRRAVLSQKFTEPQRLMLEQYILNQRVEQQKHLKLQKLRRQHKLQKEQERQQLLKIQKRQKLQQQQPPKLQQLHLHQPQQQLQKRRHLLHQQEVEKPQDSTWQSSANSRLQRPWEVLCFNKDGQSSHVSTESKGRSSIRGIASHVRRGHMFYNANTNLGMIRFITKEVTDLALAIDFLMILIAIKQRVLQTVDASEIVQGGPVAMIESSQFELRIREAVSVALGEESPNMQNNLGLRFQICIPARRWIGTALVTPWFRISDLDRGLRAWRRLHDARGQRSHDAFHFCNPEGLRSTWANVRDAFLGVLDDLGRSRASIIARLDAREEAHRPRRELTMERWNRWKMACEERNQHAAICAEQKREQRERRLMEHADSCTRRAERWYKQQEKNMFADEPTERQIDRWLTRWAKHDTKNKL